MPFWAPAVKQALESCVIRMCLSVSIGWFCSFRFVFMLILASCWTTTVCHLHSLESAKSPCSARRWELHSLRSWAHDSRPWHELTLGENIPCDFCPGSSPFLINTWPGAVLSHFTLLVCFEEYVVKPRCLLEWQMEMYRSSTTGAHKYRYWVFRMIH